MIYLPLISHIDSLEDLLYDDTCKVLVSRKNELSWADRISAALFILDHLGYTWEEFADERRQKQYYIDEKRRQIEQRKNKTTLP